MHPTQYPVWEQMILSGQVPDDALHLILSTEPEFAAWIRRRAEERQK